MNKIKSELHQDSFWISIMFRISIVFFKIIGFATFTYRTATHKKRTLYTFQYSKFGIIYNVMMSSLIIASTYVSIPFCINMNMEYENKPYLNVAIELLQIVLGTLAICITLLNYSIYQKSWIRIANRLMDVEHEIDRLYDSYRSLRRQRIFCSVIVVCILNLCLLISLLITQVLTSYADPISWLIDILPIFYVGWLLIQYFLLVTVIQADFADLNQAIQNITKINTSDLQPQSLFKTRHIGVNNSYVPQLVQLRYMHCHLCKITEDVSGFYSLPVLFGIIFLFLTLVYNGFYLFLLLLMIFSSGISYYIFISLYLWDLNNTIMWLIYLIYPVSLLTNRITNILIEMEKTGNIIHSLLRCAIGKEIKSELKQFSLELLHRKIHFTVNGYFTLDNNFLYSLIGTMVTYLVILVQFQMGNLHSSRSYYNFTEKEI